MAMTESCKTCRRWNTAETWYEHPTEGEWGSCRRTDFHNGKVCDETTLAFAQDVEQYSAELRTRAEFCCIQFEEKTDGEAKEEAR